MNYRLRSGATTINLTENGTVSVKAKFSHKVGARGVTEVKETPVLVVEGTAANLIAFKDQIGVMLAQAALYTESRLGDRVYLDGRLTDTGDWWSTEILGGVVNWVDPWMVSYEIAELGIEWDRKNYWLGPLAQAPLTNANGTNNTTGLAIWNHDDSGAGHDNYVQINGASIPGDLPALTRIEMTNTLNASSRTYHIWIAQNVYADPANFQHVIEAESAAYALGGSVVSNAAYSGGAVRSFVWTGDTQTLVARWTLSTDFLNHARGNWFKILTRFSALPLSGTRLQFKLTFPAGTPLSVVATSQEVTPTSAMLQDLATLQLPPWLIGQTDFAPIDLSLYARRTGGGSFALDDLQLMALGGYRILSPRGYGASYGVRVVDDAIDGTVWTDGWTPAGKTGHYTGQFDQIALAPGKTQRLYFLQSSDTGGVSIDRTMSVKVFYQPRRMAL